MAVDVRAGSSRYIASLVFLSLALALSNCSERPRAPRALPGLTNQAAPFVEECSDIAYRTTRDGRDNGIVGAGSRSIQPRTALPHRFA